MRRILTSIASFVSWHRRVVGALLAAAAVLLTVQTLKSPEEPTVTVAVVTTDSPAGHTLSDADLALRDLPPDAVPSGALTELVAGQSLAVPVTAGTVLQRGLLTSAMSAGPGRAIVPVTIHDERLRKLLRPGDEVTLIVTLPEGASVLTNDARIATLPAADTGGSAISVASGRESELVLVDVPGDSAATVASHGQGGQLSVVLGTV